VERIEAREGRKFSQFFFHSGVELSKQTTRPLMPRSEHTLLKSNSSHCPYCRQGPFDSAQNLNIHISKKPSCQRAHHQASTHTQALPSNNTAEAHNNVTNMDNRAPPEFGQERGDAGAHNIMTSHGIDEGQLPIPPSPMHVSQPQPGDSSTGQQEELEPM
jgi:hypothetical protein